MLYIDSNGALKLNIKESGMEVLWNFALFLIFVTSTIVYTGTSQFGRVLQWIGYGLLGFISFTEIFSENRHTKEVKLRISLITIWYGIFFVFSSLSVLWAHSPDGVMYYSDSLIRVALLGFCLSQHLNTEEKLNKSMKMFIFTCIIAFIYSLIRTPKDLWFSGSLGNVTGHSITALGLCAAFAMVMSMYFAMAHDEKLYYIAAAANFIFVVAATSRKALLFAAMGVMLLELLYTWRRNYFVSVVTVLIAIGLFSLLILKSGISDAMNQRLMSMYNYFTDGGGKKDGSISMRWYLIMTAKNLFYNHPLVGVGLGNFSYFLDDVYGQGVYAHNNYMEIIADLGITGFVIYYWFYLYLIIRLLQQTLRKQKLSLLFLVVMISFMVIEYGQVTYYQHNFQLVVAFAYCAVCISDGEWSAKKENPRYEDGYRLPEDHRLFNDQTL